MTDKKKAQEERLSNESIDLITTADVAKLFHRSVPCVHKWLKTEGVIPDYAKPFRLHPGQRAYFWSKKAIFRWIEERRSA